MFFVFQDEYLEYQQTDAGGDQDIRYIEDGPVKAVFDAKMDEIHHVARTYRNEHTGANMPNMPGRS